MPKALQKSRQNPSLAHWCVSITEGPWAGQAGFALGEAVLAVPNLLPVLHCLSRAERIHSMILQHRGEVTGQLFPAPSFTPLLKMSTMFPLFSPCHSTWLPWPFKYHGEGIGSYSNNSLRTLGCISFLRWSRTWSFLAAGNTFLPQSPCCCPSTLEVWEEAVTDDWGNSGIHFS